MKNNVLHRSAWLFSICLILFFESKGFSQNYSYQNGFTLAGGVSSTLHYNNDFKKISEKNISEKPAFSWEISYLNTKSLNEKVAFTYGLSVLSLRNSFKTGLYTYTKKDDSKEVLDFIHSENQFDRYFVGISFQWSFFLNPGPDRFYIGPGFSFRAPVFMVNQVSGSTAVSDSISFKDKYLP